MTPSGGAAASAGATIPHSPIREPPTGLVGTGSGAGEAWPGAGFSDVSTGAGGVALLAQPASGFGAGGFGAANAADAGIARAMTAASDVARTLSDRRDALCTHAG
ncbi:hypothetical protein GCM10023192_46380 [Amycolatopsis samaneae]